MGSVDLFACIFPAAQNIKSVYIVEHRQRRVQDCLYNYVNAVVESKLDPTFDLNIPFNVFSEN